MKHGNLNARNGTVTVCAPVTRRAMAEDFPASGARMSLWDADAGALGHAPRANADGKPMRMTKPGTLTNADASPRLLVSSAKLFKDRAYIAAELPAPLKNAHFIPVARNDPKTLQRERAGTVFFLTPVLERNRDTVAQPLMDRAFEKVALPEIPLFNPTSPGNFYTLFQKDCAAGETSLIGKWAVPVFLP